MLRTLKRTLPLLIAVLLFGLAWPAWAQRGTQPSPQPGNTAAGELCIPVGLALAVIGDTGLAAEAMGQAAASTTIGSRAPSRAVVTYAPATVGACAELQAFWGDSVGGKAAASLKLYDDQGVELASDDAGAGRNTGPARHSEPLKTLVKLTEAKKYAFVAVLEVKASGGAASIGTSPAEASDSLKVPFTVELRERPAAQPQVGHIAGTVTNADGAPIEGARINVILGANAITPPNPRRPLGELPVLPGTVLGAAGGDQQAEGGPQPAGDQDPSRPGASTRGAVSGADGTYQLAAAPGKYLVTASADGYTMQWYSGAADAAGATPVEVKAGETTANIDFSLQPRPMATISGTVKDANGAAVAGALVMAVKRQITNPATPPNTRVTASTRADADGKYTLKLDPATYAIGASQPALVSSRQGKTIWWDGKADIADADLLDLAAGTARDGIDLNLP